MTRAAIPLLLFSAFLGICTAAGAGDPPKETPQSIQRNIDELERQQAQLIQDSQKQINSLKDGPRREELRRLLAEIERRTPPRKLYLWPSAKMTTEMAAYHARVIRRLEDCGTRNFPKREGRSVYGKGLAAITLDRNGKAVNTEILESSGKSLLDAHMAKIVRASSPFGVLPAKALVDESTKPFDLVVVVSAFNFENDAAPVPTLDEKERCKWQ